MKNTPIYFQVSEKYGFLKTSQNKVGQHRQVSELSAVHFKDVAEENPNISLDLISQPTMEELQQMQAEIPPVPQEAQEVQSQDVLFGKKETEPIMTPELTHTLGEVVTGNPGSAITQHIVQTFLNAGLSVQQVSDILKLSTNTLTRGLN